MSSSTGIDMYRMAWVTNILFDARRRRWGRIQCDKYKPNDELSSSLSHDGVLQKLRKKECSKQSNVSTRESASEYSEQNNTVDTMSEENFIRSLYHYWMKIAFWIGEAIGDLVSQ